MERTACDEGIPVVLPVDKVEAFGLETVDDPTVDCDRTENVVPHTPQCRGQ